MKTPTRRTKLLVIKYLEIIMKEFEDANPTCTKEQRDKYYNDNKDKVFISLGENEENTIGFLKERINLEK